MKTERRQELRTNELGAFLLDANDWARKYAYHLGGGIVVIVAAVLAMRYLQLARANTTDSAVVAMMGLSFEPEEAESSFGTLEGIIAETRDPDVKMAALLRTGTAALTMARKVDTEDPSPHLDRAEAAFQELRREYPERMPVVATALSSLAAIEADRFVIDHDMAHRETARKYLEAIQNDPLFKGSPFQTDAAERLLHLDGVFQVITLAEPAPLPPMPDAATTPVPTGQIINAPPGVQIQRLDGPPPGLTLPGTPATEPAAKTPQSAPAGTGGDAEGESPGDAAAKPAASDEAAGSPEPPATDKPAETPAPPDGKTKSDQPGG